MSKHSVTEIDDLAEAYEKATLEILRPLAKFVSPDAPTRKTDIVPFLIRTMTDEAAIRELYDKLGEIPKAAIQEAIANPLGVLNVGGFKAKYGQKPDPGTRDAPTRLNLFFPLGWYIPRDLRQSFRGLCSGHGLCLLKVPRSFHRQCRNKSRHGGSAKARSQTQSRYDSVQRHPLLCGNSRQCFAWSNRARSGSVTRREGLPRRRWTPSGLSRGRRLLSARRPVGVCR